ncbi:MAG: pentapeptide repeat-containing protein [Chloroflexi bacterium]|nr:pentapeptide repeat-containing protein [Chloroflexota bacterium]
MGWAKRVRQLLLPALIAAALIVLLILLVVTVLYPQPWTGLPTVGSPPAGYYERGKTLWDWLELLIVPAALVIAAFLFDRFTRSRESNRQEERLREQVLQKYFDDSAGLLLDRGERDPEMVRRIRALKTITVLRRLDAARRQEVIEFLRTTDTGADVPDLLRGARMEGIDLTGVDMTRFNLENANLERADLEGATLINANLSGAKLSGSTLVGADLTGAILRGANLNGADLRRANLTDATVEGAYLADADLTGATVRGVDLSTAMLSDTTRRESDEA